MPLAVEILRQRKAQKKPAAGIVAPTPGVGLTLDPIMVRAQVAEQRRLLIDKRLHAMAFRRGQLLFEGQWACPKDVRRVYRRMWLRSLLYVVESLLVMALLVGTAGFLWLILSLLGG